MAMLALSAATVASASAALPEFEPVGKKFPVKFKSKSGAGTLETVGGRLISCTADTNVGEHTGAKALIVVVTFTGCTTKFLGITLNCQTAAAKKGEIITKELEGTLGYINKAAKEVGVALKPKGGGNFVNLECEGIGIEVRGSVIGVVTPLNKLVKTTEHFTLTFSQAKGVQKPTKLEGEAKDVLETSTSKGAFEESGLGTADEITFVEEAKINA